MKTIEEEARKMCAIMKGMRDKVDNLPFDEDMYLAAFRQGAQFTQEWISVKDEPVPNGERLLAKRNGYVIIGRRVSDEFLTAFRVFKLCEITHWRLIEWM